MAAQERIYMVIDQNGKETLVQATNQAAALRHISGTRYSIRPAKTMEVAEFFKSGGTRVEVAGEEEADDDESDLESV